MFKFTLVFYLIGLAELSWQLSEPEYPSYQAAVVEYNRNFVEPAEEYIKNTVAKYINLIQSAEKQKVDIIVFPEATLNHIPSIDRSSIINAATEVPDPALKTVPCDIKDGSYKELLVNLSCQARDNGIYVVINVSERSPCSEESQAAVNDTRRCASDGISLYNTNVVLNSKGQVISRYRKFNLFGEAEYNTTAAPDNSTFETEFGVVFGHFICFDLMFKAPALDLVKNGIKNIIFPTMWFSELPFLTAIQIQEAWAYKNEVNLLAAGAQMPEVGSYGSGIYHGTDGALTTVISGIDGTHLLVATVPKYGFVDTSKITPIDSVIAQTRNFGTSANDYDLNLDNIILLRDQIDVYESKVLTSPGKFSEKICSTNNLLCCSFDIESKLLEVNDEIKGEYTYRLAVYNGMRTFGGFIDGSVMACAVLASINETLAGCGLRFPDHTDIRRHVVFDTITISGTFPEHEEILTLPNSLTDSLQPLNAKQFKYKEIINAEKEEKVISISLTESVNNLHTFGIYGRDFSKDGSASSRSVSFVLLAVVISFCILMNK